MRRLVLLPVLALALTGCGSSDEDAETPADAGSEAAAPADEPTFPGGRALSEYEGLESYPWRVAIIEQQVELLADLQAVAPWIDDADFGDVVSVCDAISRGMSTGAESAVAQFSKGPDETVTPEQGAALYAVIESRGICS